MTLQELIDELNALPISARTATTIFSMKNQEEFNIDSIVYESGEVLIRFEEDGDVEDNIKDDFNDD